MKKFEVNFAFKYPSLEIRDLDLREVSKKAQLDTAISQHNKVFEGKKEIKLIDIQPKSFTVVISDIDNYAKSEKDVPRLFNFVSRKLTEFGWKRYSTDPNKLFKSTYVKEIKDENIDLDEKITDDEMLQVIQNIVAVRKYGNEEIKHKDDELVKELKTILLERM